MKYLIQEKTGGEWHTIEPCADYEAAAERLAEIEERHPTPTEYDPLTEPAPQRYRIGN